MWQLPEDRFRPSPPELLHTFDCGAGAVLAIVARGDTVYAGCQDGLVKVWDLETRTLVRTLLVVEVNPPLHRFQTSLIIISSEHRHSIDVTDAFGFVCLFGKRRCAGTMSATLEIGIDS